MYKVFTDKSVVTIKEKSSFSENNDYLNDVQFGRSQLENQVAEIDISTQYPQKVFEEIFKDYKVIEAAGGLVLNEEDDFLVIHRLGKWDLPKGKIEKNEAIKAAAIREVEEECGIQNISIKNKLIDTYHTYELKGKMILKKTHWYLMKTQKSQNLVPQLEEDISEVKWLPWENRRNIFSNTYENIKEVIYSYEKIK